MRRDLIKTLGGIIIVGLVVLATFLYGRHQSDVQKHKQQVLEQQQQRNRPQSQSPAPVAPKPAPNPQPQTQPAPQSQPSAGSNQPAPASPTPTAQAPANPGYQTSTVPRTGGEVLAIPLLALILASQQLRRSRRRLKAAVLSASA